MCIKSQRMAFWALAVALVFGIALHWPLFVKVIVIALSGIVLSGVAVRVFNAYRNEV